MILPQTEAEPIFQDERTLVKGKQQNAEDATMACYDECSGFKLQV